MKIFWLIFLLYSPFLISQYTSSEPLTKHSLITLPIPLAVIVHVPINSSSIFEISLESILRTSAFDNFEPHLLLLSHEEVITGHDSFSLLLKKYCDIRFHNVRKSGSCRVVVPNASSSPSSNPHLSVHPLVTSLKFIVNQHKEVASKVKAILYLDSFIQLTRGSLAAMYSGLEIDYQYDKDETKVMDKKPAGGIVVIPSCLSLSKGIIQNPACPSLYDVWNIDYLPLGLSLESLGQKMYGLSSGCVDGVESRVLMISLGRISQLLQGHATSSSLQLPSRWSCQQVFSSLIFDITPESLHVPSLQLHHSVPTIVPQKNLNVHQEMQTIFAKYATELPVLSLQNISVLFLLSAVSVSGGIVSILQEVIELRARGFRVHVGVASTPELAKMTNFIQGLSPTNKRILEGMILTFTGKCCFPFQPSSDLMKLAGTFDVVVGTYYTTISAITAISEKYPKILPAYYVQDYEPWFLCNPKECLVDGSTRSFLDRSFFDYFSPREQRRKSSYLFSLSSYSALHGKILMFAKSDWIIDMVKKNHGKNLNIQKVTPSIDHLTYYHLPETSTHQRYHTVQVIAMIRPRTPRRNAMVCMDLLLKLAHQFVSFQSTLKVSVVFFGSPLESIDELFNNLIDQRGFAPHRTKSVLYGPQVKIFEVLTSRFSLADLYRQSDIFIDLSWWQAFGRSGVEAMACGCVPIFPANGAGPEVCEGGKSCLYHDTDDEEGYYEKLVSLAQNHTYRQLLSKEGIRRSGHYSVELASTSIMSTLSRGYEQWKSITKGNRF